MALWVVGTAHRRRLWVLIGVSYQTILQALYGHYTVKIGARQKIRGLTRLWFTTTGDRMTAPHCDGIEIASRADGSTVLQYYTYFLTNVPHREARAQAIANRLSAGAWRCHWCYRCLPTFKRADTLYCSEGCRKRTARRRRSFN